MKMLPLRYETTPGSGTRHSPSTIKPRVNPGTTYVIPAALACGDARRSLEKVDHSSIRLQFGMACAAALVIITETQTLREAGFCEGETRILCAGIGLPAARVAERSGSMP